MIKHIVAVKLEDRARIEELEAMFIMMKAQIREINEIKVERNVYVEREANYDIIFNVFFDTIEDMKAYLVHPVHVELGSKLRNEYAESLATMDVKE